MKLAAAVSVLLHGLLVAAVLLPWRPGRPSAADEVPAKIEVVFGKSALVHGAPASAAAPAVRAPPTAAAASRPATPAGSLPPGRTSVRTEQVRAPARPETPVRLGDGLVGFDVPVLDPGIVAAQFDPGNRPPRYPDGAWSRREHGVVVLRIHIRPDGMVGSIETLQSSGFADLDDAASGAARRWRFIPQLRDGRPVASARDQAINFVLE